MLWHNINMSALSEQKINVPETVQDMLLRLEKLANNKQRIVEELKEKLYVAQEERFKAHLELSNAKEQYLISAVNNLQIKLTEPNKNTTNETVL
jgi:hypothetical protein